jgi:hypothetical protein
MPLRRLGCRRSNHPGVCLTPFVALSGFLTLSALCSPPDLPALFHAGNVPGVRPSELSPSEEPYRLSAAAALMMLPVYLRTTRPAPATRNGPKPAARIRMPSGCFSMASSRHGSPSASGRLLRKAVHQPKPATDTFRSRHSRSPSGHASHPRPKPPARPCPACARLPRGSPSAPPGTRPVGSSGLSRTSRTVGLAPHPSPWMPKHPERETRDPASPSTSTT